VNRTSANDPAQSSGMPPGRQLRVIIADDDRDTVATLSAIFADEGHSVVGVHSGPAAIIEIRRGPPDVLIVDISMPGMSGYSVAREVRRLYGELAPMLIAISGKWTGQSDRMVSKVAGFHYFLEKPCDPQVLLSLLAPLKRQPPTSSISLVDDTIPPGPGPHASRDE
jgi:DNA-binding response OmpR family regulator